MTILSIQRLSFALLRGCCVLCSAASYRTIDLCQACERDLPWIRNACLYCGLPLSTAGEICSSCSNRPPAFSAVISLLAFSFPVDAMILRFKEQRMLAEGHVLSELTIVRSLDLLQSLADDRTIIVPVPLHLATFRKRGFNQSHEIAKRLQSWTGLTIGRNVLKRDQSTKPQKQLALADRQKNLKGVFHCSQSLRGLRVILVDDVVTTTATVSEITRLLLRQGAEDVVVFALARTPQHAY